MGSSSTPVSMIETAARCFKTTASSTGRPIEESFNFNSFDSLKFESNRSSLEYSASWKAFLARVSQTRSCVKRRNHGFGISNNRQSCSFPSKLSNKNNNHFLERSAPRFQGNDRRAFSSTEIMYHRLKQKKAQLRKARYYSNRTLHGNISNISFLENTSTETFSDEFIEDNGVVNSLANNNDASLPYLLFALLITLRIDGLLDILVAVCSKLVKRNPYLNHQPIIRAILSLENDPVLLRMKSQREIDYSINHIYRHHDDLSLQGQYQCSHFMSSVEDDESLWGHFTDIDAGSISSLRDFVSWNPTCFSDDSIYVEDLTDIAEEAAEINEALFNENSHSSKFECKVDEVSCALESFFGLS